MKLFNCPDCLVTTNSCDGCQRAQMQEKPSNINVETPNWLTTTIPDIPNCCQGCSNHPSNGGSGICHCMLPYLTKEYTITCTSVS